MPRLQNSLHSRTFGHWEEKGLKGVIMGQLLRRYTCPKCKEVYIEPLDPDEKNCPDCKVPFKIDWWEAVKHIKMDND